MASIESWPTATKENVRSSTLTNSCGVTQARTSKETNPQNVTESIMAKLQAELNEKSVRHKEDTYCLQLELKTVRQAKEDVEHRIDLLYRDMQEIEINPDKRSPVLTVTDPASDQYINTYELALCAMNNQIKSLSTSSDAIIQSLKDEICVLMEDKVQTELALRNELITLKHEKQDLEKELAGMGKNYTTLREEPEIVVVTEENPTAPSPSVRSGEAAPRPPCRHKSIEYDDPTPLRTPRRQKSAEDDDETIMGLLKDDLNRLRQENKMLKELVKCKSFESVQNPSEQVQHLFTSNKNLETELETMHKKVHTNLVQWVCKRSDVVESNNKPLTTDISSKFDFSFLDHLASIWEKANNSIQSIERVIKDVESNSSQEAKRGLSVLKIALLVHGQIQISLMLVELQFRNYLLSMEIEGTSLWIQPTKHSLTGDRNTVLAEVIESIRNIEALADEEIQELRENFGEESSILNEIQKVKVIELQKSLLERQAGLEEEIARLKVGNTSVVMKTRNALEMLVSQQELESLQEEVLLIVERVKGKNEIISRMAAEIEEHRVRERMLTEEVNKHVMERQQLADQQSQYETSSDGSTCTDNENIINSKQL